MMAMTKASAARPRRGSPERSVQLARAGRLGGTAWARKHGRQGVLARARAGAAARGFEPIDVTWDGKTLPLGEWARILGRSYPLLLQRWKAHQRDPDRWPLLRVFAGRVRPTEKIDAIKAAEIRRLLDGGARPAAVARQVGCTYDIVQNVRHGRCWTKALPQEHR